MKLTEVPLVIVCWAQPGCPSCASYLRKFRQVAAQHKNVATHVVDVNLVYGASEHFGVKETPTTTVLRYGRRTWQVTGDSPVSDIRGLFFAVERGKV